MTEQLENWCKQTLATINLPTAFQMSTVSSDASFRAYYRVHFEHGSCIAVTAPPATEKNPKFVSVAKALAANGVLVPKVLAVNYEQGFLLLSDLGDQTLLPLLNTQTVDAYYRSALDELIVLQQIPQTQIDLPLYDEKALQIELDLFAKWYLQGLLRYQPSSQENQLIQQLNQLLIDSAMAQPQCLVHRDYHARNIMCVDQRLAMIDFQDALWGPVSYDVVSLLKDCYIKWPRAKVLEWLTYYHRQASPTLALPPLDVLPRQFDFIGLQRHIKVLGVFARLSIRDNKHAYLADLPRVIAYVAETAMLYDQTLNFGEWLEQTITPLAHQQVWFKQDQA